MERKQMSFDDEEIKEIDDTLSSKEAEAFAKEVAREAKKKKARKPKKPRRYRKCTAGQCQRKPTHSVVRVYAKYDEGTKTISFEEKHLCLPACEPHARNMFRRFKRIEVPNVRLEFIG
jgi:hypothetical protein